MTTTEQAIHDLLTALVEGGRTPPLRIKIPAEHAVGLDQSCLLSDPDDAGSTVLATLTAETRERDAAGVWRHWLVYKSSTLVHRGNPSTTPGE
jgi:hypothetical protein